MKEWAEGKAKFYYELATKTDVIYEKREEELEYALKNAEEVPTNDKARARNSLNETTKNLEELEHMISEFVRKGGQFQLLVSAILDTA